MEKFRIYLQNKGFKKRTIEETVATAKQFLQWKKDNKLKKINSEDVLNFISENKITARVKNNRLNYLRKFFAFQLKEGKIKVNPAIDLKVKIEPRGVMKLLSAVQLDEMFEKYRTRKLRESKQEKTQVKFLSLLGLVIYQAMTSKELMRLRKTDFDLTQGTVSIHGTQRSNPRTLKLEARQIIPLSLFLDSVDEFLFEQELGNLLQHIVTHLKKLHYYKVNIQQIRESRITLWMREHNIRKVQYLTGFKYISSLQKYKNQDIEGLKEKVKLFHPLR